MVIKMKRKLVVLPVIMGIGIIYLTACGNNSAEKPMENIAISDTENMENSAEEEETDTAMPPEENTGKEEEEPGQEETAPIEMPQLPDSGGQPADFVPDGWELLDSVELDFNEDGLPDYVGVLQHTGANTGEHSDYDYPRILFAIASETAEKYRLDFQNSNLIRTAYGGGNYGDPYLPLTAEKSAFTTSAYGGSAWRWSEICTYTYREGVWRLTLSEEILGYYDYITEYSMNDWEKGVGIRKKRSDDSASDALNATPYDVVYEVPLDEPMTLEQAGMRSELADKHVTDWEVKDIKIKVEDGVAFSEDMIRLPSDRTNMKYTDENCALYCSTAGAEFFYFAMYSWKDKVLTVFVQEETEINYPCFYKGKIYYTAKMEDGIGLYRMEPDGTGKEMIFIYHCPRYSWITYEISGDEIFAEVSPEDEEFNFIYRMNTDGSECEEIGRIPNER